MPSFCDLRSDSPLYLTLVEGPYAGALKQSLAGITSPCGIRIQLRGSNRWFFSRPPVDSVFDTQHSLRTNDRHCHSVKIRVCTESRTNFCSFACAPSATESTCGLTQVRASVREFRVHLGEQLAHPVEHWCAHRHGNTEVDSCELAACLLSPKSVPCVVAEVHRLSPSGPYSPINYSSLSGVSNAELEGRSAPRVCDSLPCLFVDGRASLIK
jgi:hypothetical protein